MLNNGSNSVNIELGKKIHRSLRDMETHSLKFPDFQELVIDFFFSGEVFLGVLIKKIRQCLTIIQYF